MQVSQGQSNAPRSFNTNVIIADVSEHDFVVWWNSLVVICIFWITALIFLILDLTGWLKRYKVQPGKNEPVEIKQVLTVIDIFN